MEGGFYNQSLLRDLDLWDICVPYWIAWHTLNGGRRYAVGMGGAFPLGLEYGELSQYARDHGFLRDPDEYRHYLNLLRKLDETYLLHHAEQSKKPATPPTGAPVDE